MQRYVLEPMSSKHKKLSISFVAVVRYILKAFKAYFQKPPRNVLSNTLIDHAEENIFSSHLKNPWPIWYVKMLSHLLYLYLFCSYLDCYFFMHLFMDYKNIFFDVSTYTPFAIFAIQHLSYFLLFFMLSVLLILSIILNVK